MTYEEARNFIEDSNQYGSILGLTAITELMNRLGNPQDKIKVIHVGGTNGKGSTSAFITSILASAGYRVGRYISPVVFTCLEKVQISYMDTKQSGIKQKDILNDSEDNRIIQPGIKQKDILNDSEDNRIHQPDIKQKNILNNSKDNRVHQPDIKQEDILNDSKDNRIHQPDIDKIITEYITEQGVCDAIASIQRVCAAMVKDGMAHPTQFEIETAMAMLYLYHEKVDFAVIEVGMGGRLDATNIMKAPLCCVLTSISMDHMQYLGDTLELIAKEKAGIIKKGSIVVTGNRNPKVISRIKKTCEECCADLIPVDSSTVTDIRYLSHMTIFKYKGQEYEIQLQGEYQIENALLAINTALALKKVGYDIDPQTIKKGLFHAKWRGRFEILSTNPYLIIDGAHNEDAAQRLKKSLELYFPNRRLIFVMGVLADKEYKKILSIIAKSADLIITLTPNNGRALASSILAKEAMKYVTHVIDAGNVITALKQAVKAAHKEDVIVAFGSLTYLAEVSDYVDSLE
ncbi:MAG: Mur ligase family protein [Mobilitalea sp.]